MGAITMLADVLWESASGVPGVSALRARLVAAASDIASAAERLLPLLRAARDRVVQGLALASRDEVAELRSRLDALEALLRQGGDEGTTSSRPERPSPRMRESLERARAALVAMETSGPRTR